MLELDRLVAKSARALQWLGTASALALLATCRAPGAAEPAQPAASSSSPRVLGTWLPAVVYRVARDGETTPANDWDAILWLSTHSASNAERHFYSSASDHLSAIGTADQSAAIVTLFDRRRSRPLRLGRATLRAQGAPPLRQTPIRSYGGFYEPTYMFAFPLLEPTWHELEFRVPIADDGALVAHFIRPLTCDEIVTQYRKVLAWGTGACEADTDCSLYGGVDSASICSDATDHNTVRKLWRIRDAAVQWQCPRPHSCTTSTARCIEGVCRK